MAGNLILDFIIKQKSLRGLLVLLCTATENRFHLSQSSDCSGSSPGLAVPTPNCRRDIAPTSSSPTQDKLLSCLPLLIHYVHSHRHGESDPASMLEKHVS